jgi:hypothetical protein
MTSPVTGGPGVGKTTIIRSFLAILWAKGAYPDWVEAEAGRDVLCDDSDDFGRSVLGIGGFNDEEVGRLTARGCRAVLRQHPGDRLRSQFKRFFLACRNNMGGRRLNWRAPRSRSGTSTEPPGGLLRGEEMTLSQALCMGIGKCTTRSDRHSVLDIDHHVVADCADFRLDSGRPAGELRYTKLPHHLRAPEFTTQVVGGAENG